MKNKKKSSMKVGMIVAVLALAVGFAAIATQLVINGTIKITPDAEDFRKNVQFTDIEASTDATVDYTDETHKSITFTTKKLKHIGDTSTLTYYIKNASQYGALMDTLTCSGKTETDSANIQKYVTITSGQELDNVQIPANTAKSANAGTVTVELKRSFIGTAGNYDDDEELTINFVCEYKNITAYEADAAAPATTTPATTEAAGA